MSDAPVGLADLIAAVERLGARDEALVQRIAMFLQVEAERRRAQPAGPLKIELPPEPPQVRPPVIPDEVKPISADYRPSAMTRTRDEAPPFASPVPSLPPPTLEANEPLPPFDPLFTPSWTRSILSLALATPGAHGAVDLRRVVERFSRGRALSRLPRRVIPTMRKGVQVLVDRGSGMVPFARDAEWLVREIRLVAGQETPVLNFRGLPSRGVSDARRRKRFAYEPPPVGVPVALVTDFGIGIDDFASDRATTREWTEFLRAVKRTDSPVIAFVPYPRHRCPFAIASMVTVIEWDRRTTLTRIRAAVRHGWSRQ